MEPANPIFHFAAGTLSSLGIFLVFTRLSGVGRFSLPFEVVIIGIICASLAHFFSPWATPAVLLLYALASAHELQQDRADARAAARMPMQTDENPPSPHD